MYGRPTNGYRRRAYPTTRFKKRRYSSAPKRFVKPGMRRMPPANFAAKVRSVVKAESKFHYTFTEFANFQRTAAYVQPLSIINQGIGASGRIGNWIQPTVLYGHITVQGAPSAVLNTSHNRVCLLQYNEDESLTPFDAVILLEQTLTPGGPWKVTSKGKFTILWSAYFQTTNSIDNLSYERSLPFNVKMHKRPRCLFDVNAQKKGALFFVALTDINVGGGDPPTVATAIQLRYTDA